MQIVISCDDGDILDLKAAALLKKYGFRGIFFIPIETKLSQKDVQEIAVDHEIGGHTLSHPSDLKILDDFTLRTELETSREILQKITKQPITKFCYPRGRFDDRVKQAVKKAGYLYARTTRVGVMTKPRDMFEVDTTVHMFQRDEYKEVDVLDYAMDRLLETKRNGCYHLWFHSWEVEEYTLWGVLEYLLMKLKEARDAGI